jgi:hypothetical protein
LDPAPWRLLSRFFFAAPVRRSADSLLAGKAEAGSATMKDVMTDSSHFEKENTDI